MLSLGEDVLSSGRATRREWLRIGGLGTLGLTLPQLLTAAEQSRGPAPNSAAMNGASPLARGLAGTTFGRAKNVIYLWLQGGPPQHETFDPKPDAPAEIRGPFRPIATNVPGINFCELLPRTARIADKLAIVRSLHTNDNNHDVSGYWVLTGYPYGPGSARQIKPTDWPYFGSLVKMLKPSETLPALSSVWLPDMMRLNENVTPAGQTAGFLGKQWEPERFVGDPAAPDYHVEGLAPPDDISHLRVDRRRDLLREFEREFRTVERSGAVGTYSKLSQQAFDLITSGRAREAFAVDREPAAVRERYGRHSWGQSLLLARRLVEAGVRLVHVNWPREPGDNAVDNPLWDTHSKNADRLQDFLCPQFDVSFTALVDDLEQRGLLDETLVVAIGEFGRTPKINKAAGRDHWGNVFSFAMAGAGIRGGQVFGASDRNGGYPTVDPIRPHDLTATIFHLLGIDPGGMFRDASDRPHPLTKGTTLARLLGNGPATKARREPEGDLNFVPPYDASLLVDTDFRSVQRFLPAGVETREKGWRASAPVGESSKALLQVSRIAGAEPAAAFELALCDEKAEIPVGARALLAQEIRNARGGRYTFTIELAGTSSTPEFFVRTFAREFTCRLTLSRFATAAKDPGNVQVLASETFSPTADELAKPRSCTISAFLGSTVPGGNFAIGNGLGVAVIVERSSPGPLRSVDVGIGTAQLLVRSVSLQFDPRKREEDVVS
ncbi:MAG: DUF1501 domain-containing protein [Pirellula sp.]|nr:DUF1501 domain-containing protein [Pirellula sp.]